MAGAPPPPVTGGSSSSSPVGVWLVMGCAASLIWMAWIASTTQNRQLTHAEASFCGFGYLLKPPPR
jgi:hypothetical protein